MSRIVFVFVLLCVSLQTGFCQDFMMQGWYWDYPKGDCGAPNNWAVTLNSQAADIGSSGFTYLWLPPSSRASFGSCSNGYDPKDLYDLGEYGLGPTGLGTRAELDLLITALNSNGVDAVADVVYNHRDGGEYEDNDAVRDYIMNYPGSCSGATPYPINGKVRFVLPLGGSTGNNSGDYYFKFSSASGDSGFNGRNYKLYMETNTVGWQGMADQNESEPNGGGDCGQPNNSISLGINMLAVEEIGSCNTDEFHLALGASDFNSSGDTLFLYMEEVGGGGTGIDIRPYGIWSSSASSDIIAQLELQSRTDFSGCASGQGAMNYLNFKPNGVNPTCLTGDIDFPYFFFDIEEDQSSTQAVYSQWSEWLWNNVGYRGFRMDAVKHFEPALASSILNYLSTQGINPGMVVGEFFDSNANTLTSWANSVSAPAGVNVRAFDFAIREALKNACDNPSYDKRDVFNSGMVDNAGAGPFQAVTFVNNHDFRSVGEPIQNDAMLAYAYILTNNQIGLPCVFYPDYYGSSIPNAPVNNFKTDIDELIQFHKDFIYQSSSVDYLNRIGTPYASNYIGGFDNSSLIYQLSGGVGGKEVIVAINFAAETLKVDHGVNMTNLMVGDTLTDYLGNSNFPYALVSASNQMYIELAPRSYSIWINCNPTALPLDLLSFDLRQKESSVVLEWQTSNEVNVEGFIIERSYNNQSFKRIAMVDAQNTDFAKYSFLDNEVQRNIPVYYRIKMLDQDGSFTYSKTITTILDLETSVASSFFYPNPASNTLWLNTLDSKASVEVLDLTGKILFRETTGRSSINISSLPSGVFLIRKVNSAGHVMNSEKLIKL